MGYSVYWCNGRWQGYGVPAYCDHKNCFEEIDRGLGYAHPQDDSSPPSIFVCEKHSKIPISKINVDYSREHKDWIDHIMNDDSWDNWRIENQNIAKNYANQLNKQFKK